MAATEKPITDFTPATTSPSSLSGLNFTMSNSSGAPSLLAGSVFANIVMGTSSGYKIWVGTSTQYNALSSKDSSTVYIIK